MGEALCDPKVPPLWRAPCEEGGNRSLIESTRDGLFQPELWQRSRAHPVWAGVQHRLCKNTSAWALGGLCASVCSLHLFPVKSRRCFLVCGCMNRRILHKTASAVWVRGSAARWTGYRGLLAALRVSFSGGQLPPSQEVCPHLLREQAREIMIQGCTSLRFSCLAVQTKPVLKSTGRQHP